MKFYLIIKVARLGIVILSISHLWPLVAKDGFNVNSIFGHYELASGQRWFQILYQINSPSKKFRSFLFFFKTAKLKKGLRWPKKAFSPWVHKKFISQNLHFWGKLWIMDISHDFGTKIYWEWFIHI